MLIKQATEPHFPDKSPTRYSPADFEVAEAAEDQNSGFIVSLVARTYGESLCPLCGRRKSGADRVRMGWRARPDGR
jgi:hypothetical protein